MSIDKSLSVKGKLARTHNVLRRMERVKVLQKEDRWKSGDSVFGLPKVKVLRVKKKAKAEKEAPKEAAAPAAPATPSA